MLIRRSQLLAFAVAALGLAALAGSTAVLPRQATPPDPAGTLVQVTVRAHRLIESARGVFDTTQRLAGVMRDVSRSAATVLALLDWAASRDELPNGGSGVNAPQRASVCVVMPDDDRATTPRWGERVCGRAAGHVRDGTASQWVFAPVRVEWVWREGAVEYRSRRVHATNVGGGRTSM